MIIKDLLRFYVFLWQRFAMFSAAMMMFPSLAALMFMFPMWAMSVSAKMRTYKGFESPKSEGSSDCANDKFFVIVHIFSL